MSASTEYDTTGCIDKGGFITTRLGKVINIVDPDPTLFDIRDIAYALSHQSRYGGHADPPVNVAQHSCMVHDFLSADLGGPVRFTASWRLSALLHDAEEAYLVDLPRPVKALFPGYRALGEQMRKAIYKRFGCSEEPSLHTRIKFFDNVVLGIEAVNVMTKTVDSWNLGPEIMAYSKEPFEAWSSVKAEAEFLSRFKALNS